MPASRLRMGLLAGALGLTLTGPAAAQTEKPLYGGALEIGTVYVTLSALSWDPADWNWKLNHDTGQFYEQLFAADLTKSRRHNGKHPFYADAWLPSDAIRGELAESWEWKENPLRVEVKLRKGIMFPEKPGVMAARELTADDVVFTFDRLDKSPKKIVSYFDHVDKVAATDSHTVVFTFKEFHAEWDYRFGYGYFSADLSQGGRGRRRCQLEERQRHRAVHALRLRVGQFQHLHEESELLGQGNDRRHRLQAALRRQDHLSHHQGRGDLHHRAAHRQAGHPGEHPLAERRAAQEERAHAAVVEVAQHVGNVPVDARRH